MHASTHLIWRIVTSGATPPLQSSVGPLRTMNQKRLLLITNLFTISIPTRIKRIHDVKVLYKYVHVLYILKCIWRTKIKCLTIYMYTDTGITLETVTVFFHYNSKASPSTCMYSIWSDNSPFLPPLSPSLPPPSLTLTCNTQWMTLAGLYGQRRCSEGSYPRQCRQPGKSCYYNELIWLIPPAVLWPLPENCPY